MKFDKKDQLILEASRNTSFPPIPDKDQAWNHLLQQIKIADTSSNSNKASTNLSNTINNKWRLFQPRFNYVGFSMVFLIIVLILHKSYSTTNILTSNAERQTVQLPDGSNIVLHSESKITYYKDFNDSHREITLEGEAYFSVKKSSAPFIINTDYGIITVLGTTFNVRSREDGFEVGVNKGQVNVSNKICSLILNSGEIVRTNSIFTQNNLKNVSYDNYPGWINNQLYCQKTKLAEVCSEIERTFNITILFSNPSLKNISVTGLIEISNLKNALATVAILTQHEFKLEGDTCTII